MSKPIEGPEECPRLRAKLFDYITVLRTSPNIFVLFVFHKAERLKADIVSMVAEVENEVNRSGKYLTPARISDRVWFSVYDQNHDLDRRAVCSLERVNRSNLGHVERQREIGLRRIPFAGKVGVSDHKDRIRF